MLRKQNYIAKDPPEWNPKEERKVDRSRHSRQIWLDFKIAKENKSCTTPSSGLKDISQVSREPYLFVLFCFLIR